MLAGITVVLCSCSGSVSTGAMMVFLALAVGCGGRSVGTGAQQNEEPPGSESKPTGSGVPAAADSDVSAGPVDKIEGNACGQGICPQRMVCVSKDGKPWCLPDADADGVADSVDNCPFAANPDQAQSEDIPWAHLGDACNLCDDGDPEILSPCCDPCTDSDGDGIADWGSPDPESRDNCPFLANPDQADLDRDGLGDACDEHPDVSAALSPCVDADLDQDGDGISESCTVPAADNCPTTPSSRTSDLDGDGAGDVCDPDGIAPLPAGSTEAEPAMAQMQSLRAATLQRLARAGVLDAATVRIAMKVART
jgi:hypothetical protein